MKPGSQADSRQHTLQERHPAWDHAVSTFRRNIYRQRPRCPLSWCLALSNQGWSSESPAVSYDELNGVLQFSPTHRNCCAAEVDIASVEINVRVAGLQAQCAALAGIKFHDAAQIKHKIRGTIT